VKVNRPFKPPRQRSHAAELSVLPHSGNSIMLRSLTALIFTASALLPVVGCSRSQSSPPPRKTTNSISGPNDQADLDNLALCFHQAVTVLQAEPDTPKDIATFLKDAKEVVGKSQRDSRDADFTALRWNSDGTSLITRSGKPIRSRVAKQTHDNYGSQGSEWLTEYEFYAPDSTHTSRTTIQLAMRQ
jgi:hypothetical protein